MATNKKLIIRFLLNGLFVGLLFSSCQKELTIDLPSSGSTPTATNSLKVKTYSEYVGSNSSQQVLSDSFNLTYDSKDRLTSAISIIHPGKFTYTYNTNNTYTMDLYVGNTLSIHELFLLNSFSLVDSSIQVNETRDTTTEKYIYNSNKQLVTRKMFFYSSGTPHITTYNYSYDANGNVINETSDQSSTVTTYEYYLDKLNDINRGELYFYRNKNLTKTTVITSGSSAITAQHTYTFDSINRQIEEKIVINNGSTAIKKYTY